ncbi:hypothetical protein T439DRAFT_356584 [Meredithblackwellia eburnea MCA 4105]
MGAGGKQFGVHAGAPLPPTLPPISGERILPLLQHVLLPSTSTRSLSPRAYLVQHPASVLIALQSEINTPDVDRPFMINSCIVIGLYALLGLISLAGIVVRFEAQGDIRYNSGVFIWLFLTLYSGMWIWSIWWSYHARTGAYHGAIALSLLTYLLINFSGYMQIWMLLSALPAQRALSSFKSDSSRPSPGPIQRLLEAPIFKRIIVLFVPTITVLTATPTGTLAGLHQRRLYRAWISVEKLLTEAVGNGWTADRLAEASTGLKLMQNESADMFKFLRITCRFFLAYCVVHQMIYLPASFFLVSQLNAQIAHLRQSIQNLSNLKQLEAYMEDTSRPSTSVESHVSIVKAATHRAQQPTESEWIAFSPADGLQKHTIAFPPRRKESLLKRGASGRLKRSFSTRSNAVRNAKAVLAAESQVPERVIERLDYTILARRVVVTELVATVTTAASLARSQVDTKKYHSVPDILGVAFDSHSFRHLPPPDLPLPTRLPFPPNHSSSLVREPGMDTLHSVRVGHEQQFVVFGQQFNFRLYSKNSDVQPSIDGKLRTAASKRANLIDFLLGPAPNSTPRTSEYLQGNSRRHNFVRLSIFPYRDPTSSKSRSHEANERLEPAIELWVGLV